MDEIYFLTVTHINKYTSVKISYSLTPNLVVDNPTMVGSRILSRHEINEKEKSKQLKSEMIHFR